MEQMTGHEPYPLLTPETLASACGSDITVCGCVHKIRRLSALTLVMVRTGRLVLQAACSADICAAPFEGLCKGAYIELCGTVREEHRTPLGYELTLKSFNILSRPAAELPLRISDKVLECTLEASLAHSAAALRHPSERAVFAISSAVLRGFREFLTDNGFTEINTPKLCAVPSDRGAAFALRYFGDAAYLARDTQSYKQMSIAFFDRVFEAAPVFRAEKHNSARHLAQFTQLDAEMAYIRGMSDIMNIQTALLRHIISRVADACGYELELLGAALPKADAIPAVTFYEAMDMLGKPRTQPDLDPTDEVRLCEIARRETGSDFVFVIALPDVKSPVYVMNSSENPELTESFVLLLRGLEIATGGQHIHDADAMLAKLERRGLTPEECPDCMRYGLPPHGGFAMGLERLVMKLLGLDNIRRASLFPRDMHHIMP